MTRRFTIFTLPILGVLLLAASLAAAAEDYLKLIPDSAWGFVAVNQPTEVDAKVQALARELQLPVPPLVEMFKMKSAIQEGVDEKGTVVFAALAPEDGGPTPSPMLLIPVTDYDKFLAQLKPENTAGEVSEITFVGDASLARHVGGYAALTGAPFRKSIESLKVADEAPAVMQSWGQWISQHDAAGVILRPGIKSVSATGQAWLETMKTMLGAAGEQGKQAVAAFGMYGKMLQAADQEISAYGIGLQLDKQNVLRVASRTAVIPAGKWAKYLAQTPSPKENLLIGLPGDPFVAAGGAALSDAMLESIAKLSFNVMKSMPEVYGLTEEQVGKMSEQMISKFKGLNSMSMVLDVGKGDEPLYANLLSVMRVENAQTFLAGYEQYFKQYNEVIKGAKSPLLQPMEVEKCEVAGTPGLKVTMTIPTPQMGPMPPQNQKMVEAIIAAMLGPGGKMVFWIAPADEHTVVAGYVNKESMERLLASLKQKQPGLADNADLAKTVALLPPGAPVVAYLSPQGLVGLVKRMVSSFLPPGMQERMEVPDFPQTPPLGFAVKTAPNVVETTLVVPAEVIKAIAQYVQHIRGMSGENVTMDR
jgi:hypothetical protein